MSDTPLKHEAIAEELRQWLDEREPGSKLPSIRSLMERFGVSQVTIDRSLSTLLGKNLLVRRQGIGYFVPDQRMRSHWPTVEFCFCYRGEHMNNLLFSMMLSRFINNARERKFHLNSSACRDVDELRQRIERNRPAVCVLLGCLRQSFLYALRDLDVPTVSLYGNITPPDTLTLNSDNHGLIRMLVDHLAGLGHQRIAMLHGQGFDQTHMLAEEERMEAFYDALSAAGLPHTPHSTIYAGYDAATGYAAAGRALDVAPELRPTAILANDNNAPGVYQACAERGLSIPGDISVTGIDNLPPTEWLRPGLTTVDTNWNLAVDRACDEVCMILSGVAPTPGVKRLPVELVVRESTARPSKATAVDPARRETILA